MAHLWWLCGCQDRKIDSLPPKRNQARGNKKFLKGGVIKRGNKFSLHSQCLGFSITPTTISKEAGPQARLASHPAELQPWDEETAVNGTKAMTRWHNKLYMAFPCIQHPQPPFRAPKVLNNCNKTRTIKVEWEAQTGMCWWSTSTFENSYGCTAQDMPEWREMTEQTGWRVKQPSQVACFSEDLKCWGAWDTTSQGHQTIDRLEEKGVERGSTRRSSFKVRERAIVNQTNSGTITKATLGKLMRDGVERI